MPGKPPGAVLLVVALVLVLCFSGLFDYEDEDDHEDTLSPKASEHALKGKGMGLTTVRAGYHLRCGTPMNTGRSLHVRVLPMSTEPNQDEA